MDTLTFDTPARRRNPMPIPVTLCGTEFTVDRPKDAVLYFAQTVAADTVSDADRALAILQFIDGTLTVDRRKEFFDRVRDLADPLDMHATVELVTGLVERWGDWPHDGNVEPLVVEPGPQQPRKEPVRVQHPDLDIDMEAHQPKDLVLLIVAASLATTATLGQQAWSMGLFLDACLTPADSLIISHRLRDPADDLDMDHIADIAGRLVQRWQPAGNRAERRAAARAGDGA